MTTSRQDAAGDFREAPIEDARATRLEASPSERDYGDSAGYGTGGSAMDYRDVVGDDGPRRSNPLDRVMGHPRSDAGGLSVVTVLLGLAALALPLGIYMWQRSRPAREREHKARQGRDRENLARLQV
ncbi:hypothetical protein [Microvirga pudoricolor]|uniref:hypothetical protein n=1 Tax=Microvirga pudoricolor TaxID=2778729 RepID=UPI00194E82D2|nr:hypothetical protein [Microvirga pudoricolor]MBM6595181.1 hypothetical protein [Microvirga pudoricolor]